MKDTQTQKRKREKRHKREREREREKEVVGKFACNRISPTLKSSSFEFVSESQTQKLIVKASISF